MRPAPVERCLVLYTKPARPGRVKTRLGRVIGDERAAALHGAFLGDLLERLTAGGESRPPGAEDVPPAPGQPAAYDLWIAWALDDDQPLPELAAAADGLPRADDVHHLRQEGVDLGARLYRGLRLAAERHRYVVAVGSDHPELARATVDDAFRRLEEGVDLVVGPAADGGYYLIGARRETLTPALFADVPWSSAAVLERTLAHATTLGLEVARLACGHDVDEPADLTRLAARLAVDAELRRCCPRTRELLTRWGMLEAIPV